MNKPPQRPCFTERQDYFEIVDTPNKAYALGFIYADGNVTKDGRVMKIAIHKKDVELLEWLKEEVETKIPIRRSGPYRYLSIGSRKMVADLARHGVMPAKTFKIRWPAWLPENLHAPFILGYFDGDGCISLHKSHRMHVDGTKVEHLAGRGNIISNSVFAGQLHRKLRRIGILCGLYQRTDTRRCKIINFSGFKALASLGRYLYSVPCFSLKRKREKFERAYILASRERHGHGSGTAILTKWQLREIVKLLLQGVGQVRISKETGISQSTISKIKNGERWSHLLSPGVVQQLKNLGYGKSN